MNVFDFDNTLYDGESALDFFFFCLKRDKRLFRYLPGMLLSAARYKAGLLSFEKLYAAVARMSAFFTDNQGAMADTVADFWCQHQQKLKPTLLSLMTAEDVVATASPDFLMAGVMPYLPTARVICSAFDLSAGRFLSVCYRENKVTALKARFPDETVERVYTDSMNDKPLIAVAKAAYLVKGLRVERIS